MDKVSCAAVRVGGCHRLGGVLGDDARQRGDVVLRVGPVAPHVHEQQAGAHRQQRHRADGDGDDHQLAVHEAAQSNQRRYS